MNPSNELLRTRQHFEVLDGMRGVAAIAVVVFHFMEIVAPNPVDSFISHAYLAVDFFYCLSGFVVAYAYDSRLKDLGAWTFLKLRLIRLHPLVLFMAFVGLLVFITDPFSDLWKKYSADLGYLLGSSALMVPYAIVKERYNNLFHLNPPTWSLFWEYAVNIFYALVLVRTRRWMLWILLLVSAAWLCFEASRYGNVGVGWSGKTFWGGAARVSFSFLAGLMVYRFRLLIRLKTGVVLPAILLLLSFLVPFSPGYNQFIDPVLVIAVFPLLVAIGAGSAAKGLMARICNFLGEISYPLYMVHYPFIWLFMSYVEKYKPTLPMMLGITAAGTVLLTGLSYVVLKKMDEPFRKFLKKKFV
ncbi:MAG: acyltransferase [Chitinophagaceae bacterium]|nr:MAG: acyltransferase [Chitinophagaceae bacterium]